MTEPKKEARQESKPTLEERLMGSMMENPEMMFGIMLLALLAADLKLFGKGAEHMAKEHGIPPEEMAKGKKQVWQATPAWEKLKAEHQQQGKGDIAHGEPVKGRDVVMTAPGVIIFSGIDPVTRNQMIVVGHGDGDVTVYQQAQGLDIHNEKFRAGQHIEAGTDIGDRMMHGLTFGYANAQKGIARKYQIEPHIASLSGMKEIAYQKFVVRNESAKQELPSALPVPGVVKDGQTVTTK
jgi:hypothetical protein